MRTEHIDRRLADLHKACERISANLVDLEIDSGRQLLEATRLEGQSAARWAAASAERSRNCGAGTACSSRC